MSQPEIKPVLNCGEVINPIFRVCTYGCLAWAYDEKDRSRTIDKYRNFSFNKAKFYKDLLQENGEEYVLLYTDEELEQMRAEASQAEAIRFVDSEIFTLNCEQSAPSTYTKAVSCSENKEWLSAIQTELKLLRENGVYSLVERKNVNKNINDTWWVFTKKESNCFKAQLVVRGFKEITSHLRSTRQYQRWKRQEQCCHGLISLDMT